MKYLLSLLPVCLSFSVNYSIFRAMRLFCLFVLQGFVLTRMALGDGHILKALSQPLDTISLAEKVWETCNVEDSSKCIDFIHHSRQLFELLVKACLAPCAIYAAFNYLYSLEPVIYISSCWTTHRMTSAYEARKSGASYTDVELAMKAESIVKNMKPPPPGRFNW